ncbi:MAG TPA: META domain-containing protein [Chitinophagaceae bacterium]|jgi:heat shock protein HslJ
MRHFLLFIAIAIILCAFTKQNTNSNHIAANNKSSTAANDTTIAGNWVLQPVLASDTAAGNIPKLNFNLNSKKFSGNTGCNDISGSFFIRKDSLAFNEHFISTRKLCEGYNEKTFIENLTKTNHYKIVDGVLQLMNDQTVLSKWTRRSETTKSNKI